MLLCIVGHVIGVTYARQRCDDSPGWHIEDEEFRRFSRSGEESSMILVERQWNVFLSVRKHPGVHNAAFFPIDYSNGVPIRNTDKHSRSRSLGCKEFYMCSIDPYVVESLPILI